MAELARTYSLAGVTTGTGDAVTVPATVQHLRADVIGTGTISGGTLVLEEAWQPDYPGTWSALSQIAAAIDLTAVSGGAMQSLHFFGRFDAVRARLSSDVTGGGDVTVLFVGA